MLYALPPGGVSSPATEPRLTMVPRRWFRIPGRTKCAVTIFPVRVLHQILEAVANAENFTQRRKGKTGFEQELREVTEISVFSLSSCVKLLCLSFLGLCLKPLRLCGFA
jgi:hypothetical protein